MPDRAQPAGFRAFALCAALLAVLLTALAASPARSAAAGAQISIVNGHPTTIAEWPWQVAIASSKKSQPKQSPRARFFCGGSLLTPGIVITAGHCVADLKPRAVKRIEVIGGRTRLNAESEGTVSGVTDVVMPLRPDGTRRYSSDFGVANWDVALLVLKTPIDQQTIKIAGEDEADSWSPGQTVPTTGWGVTDGNSYKSSNVLRVANQVMLSDGLCRRANGRAFRAKTMNCLGAPSVNTSTCFGDSGGPLVASVGLEYRLIGLTSFGDAACRPAIPSVDSRIAGLPMRKWIQETVIELTGIDPVGSGGVAPPPRIWCKVPDTYDLQVREAKAAIRAAGCKVKMVQGANVDFGRRGRIIGASFLAGWLTPLGTAVELYFRR